MKVQMEESKQSTIFGRRRNERSVEAIGSGRMMNAGIGAMEVKTAQIIVEYRCREGDMRNVE